MTQVDSFLETLRGKGETLLIIDDEVSFVEITKILMNLAGYEVLTAFDGLEGIEVFKATLDKVRLIICDLNMPKLGGHSLIHALIALQPEIKILIISGSIVDEDIPTFLEPKKIEFLRKPFLNETLLNTLRRMLD